MRPDSRKAVGKSTSRASQPRKSATKGKGSPKAAASAATKLKPAKLLAGGNTRIAKADGDAPVQTYIAAMPGWKRDIGKRLDALIVGTVPNVRKAVKWNSPFYGIAGRGWFLVFQAFTHYVKVTFSAARRCGRSRPAARASWAAGSTSTSMISTRRRWWHG